MAGGLEEALSRTEVDAQATVRAANNAARSAKRLAAATHIGDLSGLERALAEIDSAVQTLRLQLTNTKDGWTFNAASYAQDGRLLTEIKEAAEAAGLSVHEEDTRLFSYPVLLRVSASASGDIAVTFDKKRVKGIRPSVLAAQLKAERARPQRFRTGPFIEALYRAYQWAIKESRSQPGLTAMGPSVELRRIYELLTLFPGQSREYSLQEFTRDIYLLDRSGDTKTGAGARMELSASTGTRSSRKLEIVDENGRTQVYYAIAFSQS